MNERAVLLNSSAAGNPCAVATRSTAAKSCLITLASSLLCSSCLVGPDFMKPQMDVPPGWSAPLQAGLTPDSRVDPAWWRRLGDPQLTGLVARATSGNLDIRRALARVRAARATRRGAVASFFPRVDAETSYERRRPSGTTASPSSSREFDAFAVGFDSAWEIDLFGGLRREHEKTVAEMEAAGADLNDVLVTVAAEVARNYVEVRSLQARIAIALHNVRSQRDTLRIVRWRFEAGLTGALDVDQAEYNLAETRSRIPVLERELAAARHRLAVLLGTSAGSLDPELALVRPVPLPPLEVEVGVPVDLVRRRPDVTAAERRLAAATAEIGARKADLYPQLSLTGTFGLSASDVASLDSAAARGFSVGPTLRWNLFDAGRLRSIVAQRSAEADAALADWQSVVLAAGEEVENALVAYVRERERRDRLLEARTAARKAQELARLQYENGLVDFQRVLDAERATLGFEETLAASEAAVTTNVIALYKALGGGWESFACDDGGCRQRTAG